MALLSSTFRFKAGEVDFAKVKKDLTIKYWDPIQEKTVSILAYKATAGYLHVPREYGLQLWNGKKFTESTAPGLWLKWPCSKEMVPREGQAEWMDSLHSKILADEYDLRAQAPTGMGKTAMSLEVARRLSLTTLVVVDQEFLRDQWIETATKVFGMDRDAIGIVQGNKCEYDGKVLVVAMVQTLFSRKYPKTFYHYFGTVIFDECHTVGAPVFAKSLTMFPAEHRWGVSATPDRGDAKDKLLAWHLGPVSVKTEKKHKQSRVRYVVNDTVYSWYASKSPKTGRYINEIAADMNRNMIAAYAIREMYNQGRVVLGMSDRIEHLYVMKGLLEGLGIESADIGIVSRYDIRWRYAKDPSPKKLKEWDGEVPYTPVCMQAVRKRIPSARLDQVKANCRIILATYQMFSKGVDVPRIDTGIDLTPRSKAQQQHGRILRELEGKKVPVWVTIRDINSLRGEFQFWRRLGEYEKSNVEVYEWQLDKGVRLRPLWQLAAEVKLRHAELENTEIITRLDGRNTLATTSMLKSRGGLPESSTAKTTRKRKANSGRRKASS